MPSDTPHYRHVYLNPAPRFPRSQVLQLMHEDTLYRPVLMRLVDRSFTPADAQRDFPPLIRNGEYRLIYCLSGATWIRREGEDLQLQAGELLVQSPGLQGSVKSRRPAEFRLLIIQLAWIEESGRFLALPFTELIRILFSELYVQTAPLRLSAGEQREFRDIFFSLYNKSAAGEAGAGLSELLLFLARTLRREFEPPRESKGGTDPAVEAAAEAIAGDLSRRVEIDRLAAAAHLSRSQFLRRFKRRYGVPPVVYQTRLRLEAAEALLTLTDRSASAIAEELGFGELSYFSRVFKQRCGISPGAFRKLHGRL